MTSLAASVPITIRGRYLWRGDERFFVRGVVYQVPNLQDPISDARLPELRHDIKLFKELGLNTLYVYFVDDTKEHDQAMKLLEEAGIYVFTRIGSHKRLDICKSYHHVAMDEFFRAVSTMAHYPNTLGLLVASNQVVNKDTGKAIPTVKAVVRDLKRYMKLQNKARGSRLLPLGYDDVITQGGGENTILDGLSRGESASAIDFWTCSCYIWAGQSDMLTSGYEALIDRLRISAIPIIMSEYGTNIPNPRLFQETKALYSPRMSQVFSGGCAYDFWQGKNGYGLIELIEKEKRTATSAGIVQQNDERAVARSNDQRKTAEKRETERGTLSIFHDFVNYKENLDATRSIDSTWKGDVMEREAAERSYVDTMKIESGREPECGIPDTVVDWAQVEAEAHQ